LKAASELKVTAIGDSVMADASQDIQEIMPHAYVDAEVGRQGSATPAVIKDLKAKGQLQKNVILNLGTNGAM
nr:acetyltransferase [Bifidobacterium bifidum]